MGLHSVPKYPNFSINIFRNYFLRLYTGGIMVHDITAILIGRPFGIHFIVQICKGKKNHIKTVRIYLRNSHTCSVITYGYVIKRNRVVIQIVQRILLMSKCLVMRVRWVTFI